MNDKKPGRFYGAIAFFNIIISCIMTYIIILLSGIFNWTMELDIMLKLLGISLTVFITVWGAIFGISGIKKYKGIE